MAKTPPETETVDRSLAAEVTGARAPERVAVPGWLPPVLYAVVTLLLFRVFVFSGAMLYGSDTEALGYMARAFYAQQLKAGHFPGWNPLLLGGTPFLDSLAGGDSLYPPSVLLLLLLTPFRALGWKLVLHVFLAGLFMYGWARSLGRSRAAALLAGLAYLVAPFLVTLVWPGGDGKLFVTSLTPLMFWAVESWFRGRRLLSLAGVAAVVALVILTTHFQMAYFLFGAVGIYAIFRTVQEGRRAGTGVTGAAGLFWGFLAASVVGAAGAGVQLLPAVEYVTQFSRRTATTTAAPPEQNRQYASSWSLHPEEVVSTLAVPEFVGSSVGGAGWTSGTYWGRNGFKLNEEYLGILVVVLAALAFVGGPRLTSRWFFLGMGALALLYTLGTHTPLWGLFYAVLPGIKLFRAPSLAIFLTGFSAVTLMAFGADRLLGWAAGDQERAASTGQRVIFIVAGVLGLGMLLAASGALLSMWTSVFYSDMAPDKAQALARATPFIGRGFLAVTVLVVALGGTLLLGRRGALRPSGVLIIVALLVALDGMRVDAPFVTTDDFSSFAQPDPNAQYLLDQQTAEDGPFRVLDMDNGGQSVRLGMFGIELAGGHHPNDLAAYRELTGMAGSGSPVNLISSRNVQRVLNVEYLMWPVTQYGPLDQVGLPWVDQAEAVRATQMSGQLHEVVYRLPTLPRARLVSQAEVVPGLAAVDRIMATDFDPATTATLDAPSPLQLGGGTPQGEVRWQERSVDHMRLSVTTDRNALLIVADNWYPNWQAAVDGAPAPVLEAYHTLRAIPVPAGEHEVTLDYTWGGPVRAGLGLSIAAWLLVAGVAAFSWLRTRRRGADA